MLSAVATMRGWKGGGGGGSGKGEFLRHEIARIKSNNFGVLNSKFFFLEALFRW